MLPGKNTIKHCCLLLAVILLLVAFSVTAFAEEPHVDNPITIYLCPNDSWNTDEAWFVLYYFDFNDHYDCVPMTDEDGDGFYEAVLPAGYSNFLFYRMDAAASEFDCEYILHQTDCFEYTEETRCFVLAADSWESGTWTAPPEVSVETTEETTEASAPTEAEEAEDTSESTEEVSEDSETTDAAEGVDDTADIPDEPAPVQTRTVYLNLTQIGSDCNWIIKTSDAEFTPAEVSADILAVELPVETTEIVIYASTEDGRVISSEVLSLPEDTQSNCIIAIAPDETQSDPLVFTAVWGSYNIETGECILLTPSEEDTPISEEEPADLAASEDVREESDAPTEPDAAEVPVFSESESEETTPATEA